jgi:peptidyl-prolyl cis-trans isomerase B (cyclophilin B)
LSRISNELGAGGVLSAAAAGCLLVSAVLAGPTAGPNEPTLDVAVAKLSVVRHTVQIGQPIWADFTICNPTDQPITLSFGDVDEAAKPIEPTVLPLEHVFSGPGLSALSAVSASDSSEQGWSTLLSGVGASAPPITIAPHGILGVRVNLADFYPGLVRAGTFYLTWQPFGGALVSNRVKLTVTQLKQAVIDTSLGNMTVAFEYEVAPHHVANFIELAESGFYNNKLFHMVIPGMLIHGGCPRGDGTGVRPDGKMLKAELSDLPHRAGTVSMSRKPHDLDSASCQFFICATRLRELDGQYTVFGHLVGQESFDTLQKISQVPTDEHDRPLEPVYIRQVRIVNAPGSGRNRTSSVLR